MFFCLHTAAAHHLTTRYKPPHSLLSERTLWASELSVPLRTSRSPSGDLPFHSHSKRKLLIQMAAGWRSEQGHCPCNIRAPFWSYHLSQWREANENTLWMSKPYLFRSESSLLCVYWKKLHNMTKYAEVYWRFKYSDMWRHMNYTALLARGRSGRNIDE